MSAREQLRSTNRVVPVSKEDEGRSWSKISNGVYGFTYTPASENGGIFIAEPKQSYEMHKLADGSLHIVAFATPEYAEKLSRPGAQDLEVYPIPTETATVLVVVPHARVNSSKALNRDEVNKLKMLTYTPVRKHTKKISRPPAPEYCARARMSGRMTAIGTDTSKR